MLVIGGCHTYGYGVRPGQSFVEQFGRRLEQIGAYVEIDYYTPFDLPVAASLVRNLNLDQYDLILLQLGNYRLQHPSAFKTLLKNRVQAAAPKPGSTQWATPIRIATLRSQSQAPFPTGPNTLGKQLKTGVKIMALKALNLTRNVERLNEVGQQLNDVLHALHAHRRKVVLLTLFPHLEPVTHWLRQRGRQLFRQIGQQRGVSVLDTHLYIRAQKQYFITGDSGHLNAIGHELIGLYLYDFYHTHYRQCTVEEILT
ncbi:MAG: SGNH/GDSL hydrolase family protein [Sphingobacteriales bacterium]|nr:MAG: SGNH/GDSL hydrolase family protein [Sphingobacteriales bacterium]